VADDADTLTLRLQAEKDPDVVNRFIALYRLAGREVVRLIEHQDEAPSADFVELFHALLADEGLSGDVGALHLTLFDSVDDPRFAHRYTSIYRARRRIEHAIATRYSSELKDMYSRHHRTVPLTAPMKLQPTAIRQRQLKNRCLGLLATLDTPDVHGMLRAQINGPGVATDRLWAFGLYLNSTAPERNNILESFEQSSFVHPVSWEACLGAIGGSSAPDVVSLIRLTSSSPSFRITQVNDHRALYGAFAANRKMSLETQEGRELLQEVLINLAPVNQNSTVSLLRAFGAIDMMNPVFREPLVELLVTVRDTLDPGEFPLIRNTIKRLLIGAPVAVKSWETIHGTMQ